MGQILAKRKVAFVIAATVTGGHEYQSRALVDDVARLALTKVFLNHKDQIQLFEGSEAQIVVQPGLFLEPGWIGKQVFNGIRRMLTIRRLFPSYDHIVVCAGAVEAGICTSVALTGRKNVSLYLPSFFDRTALWGRPGCLYNLVLGSFGVFYAKIITISRIQARLIRGFMHRPTVVAPNTICDLPKVPDNGPGRLLYIGRLDPQKRVSELLEWLDFDQNPYSEVLIIGDGPDRIRVATTAAHLKHMKATLLGWKSREEQNVLIGANDILLLNSIIEGEPLVIREANQRGILVIARDIPGIRGITFKRNRFSSKESLHSALKNADLGKLRKKRESNRVLIRRSDATAFLLAK
jgi:glycosyltransferase involved in cell wall biosynthesis